MSETSPSYRPGNDPEKSSLTKQSAVFGGELDARNTEEVLGSFDVIDSPEDAPEPRALLELQRARQRLLEQAGHARRTALLQPSEAIMAQAKESGIQLSTEERQRIQDIHERAAIEHAALSTALRPYHEDDIVVGHPTLRPGSIRIDSFYGENPPTQTQGVAEDLATGSVNDLKNEASEAEILRPAVDTIRPVFAQADAEGVYDGEGLIIEPIDENAPDQQPFVPQAENDDDVAGEQGMKLSEQYRDPELDDTAMINRYIDARLNLDDSSIDLAAVEKSSFIQKMFGSNRRIEEARLHKKEAEQAYEMAVRTIDEYFDIRATEQDVERCKEMLVNAKHLLAMSYRLVEREMWEIDDSDDPVFRRLLALKLEYIHLLSDFGSRSEVMWDFLIEDMHKRAPELKEELLSDNYYLEEIDAIDRDRVAFVSGAKQEEV